MLKGSALSAIAGIPLTSENYSWLLNFYRKDLVERRLLYSHCISSYRISLRLVISLLIIQQVSETIEKVLRQLEAQGESIDKQRVLIQQIISKYPPEVVTKLEETKEPLRSWSIKSLRKAICHYVTVQENVQCYVSSVNTNVKG